jgi:acyl-CoA dehydrogenase
MAGQGWRMLMECLSAGRAISLPSSAVGGAQAAALATGAYARIRKQFNQPIGKFEGIEEALARIAGNTYIIDSSLTVTASAIDQGEKSAVAGAILKYHTTEMSRDISKDAMDIHGGKGICLGPNNYLGRGYEGAPISITVEGANILTRSLIIFGQGAIRCHPYVLKELESIRDNDRKAFDRAIWGHGSLFVANFVKTLTYSFTGGRLTSAPKGFTRRYYQLINQYSANLVFLADFSMMTLGANLKRKESLSARLGDVLSYLYLISCVLRRFEHDGEPAADRPLVDWSCQYLFHKAELAIQGLIVNMPMKSARMFLKTVVQPFGLKRAYPSDRLGQKLAKMMITPNETRDRLTHLVFKEALETCPIGKVEETFNMLCSVEALERTVSQAQKAGKLHALGVLELVSEAESKGVLTAEEAKLLYQAETARLNVIAVDDFAHEALARPTAQHSKLEKAKKAKGKVEAEV